MNSTRQLWRFHICVVLAVVGLGLKSNGDKIIASPRVTDWGKWGIWEYCPSGMYVNGMQLYTHPPQGIFHDDRGLTGIRLFCNTFGKTNENLSVKSSIDGVGKWGRKYFCNGSGFMTGFQLRTEEYRSVFIDDTSANNLRMFCDGSEHPYKEGDGTNFGKWTEKRLCGPKQYIRGIKTQIDNSDDNSWDKTGLNNVMMLCSDVPHPVQNCVPTTSWRLVATCDNVIHQSNDPVNLEIRKICSYSRKVGVAYIDGSQPNSILINEHMGYGLNTTYDQFQTKFRNSSEATQKSKSDSLYWLSSPTYVWKPQISLKATASAKQKSKSYVYQIYGNCGMFQVWGTKLKIIEHTVNENGIHDETTKYVEFSKDSSELGL